MQPPGFLERRLERLVKGTYRESLPGDYEEMFHRINQKSGRKKAVTWYCRQVIKMSLLTAKLRFLWRLAMAFNSFKTALRNIRRHRVYSLLNITGLAVGLACFILIFFYVRDELSFDRFHTYSNRLFRVITEQHQEGGVTMTAETQFPLGPALNDEFPNIINSCRLFTKWQNMLIQYQDRSLVRDRVFFADPSFLKMFSFPLKQGNIGSALDDPYSIVLSQDLAQSLFGREDPMNQIIRIEYLGMKDFKVTGILEELPPQSHLRFDALIPFHIFDSLYADMENTWNSVDNYQTYVQLHPQSLPSDEEQKIAGFKARNVSGSEDLLRLQAVTDIHLRSQIKFDSTANSDIRTVYFLSMIAVFIMLIACINFINLSTARSGTRAKEIAIRQVAGAERIHMIRQFLGESLTFAAVSGLIALLLIALILPFYGSLTGKNLTINGSNALSILGLLAIITAVTGLLSGIYPAFMLSSLAPQALLRPNPASSGRLQGSLFRKVLVVAQFSISIIMILGTLVVSRQLQLLHNKDLGFDKENLVYIPLRGSLPQSFPSVKSEIAGIPGIKGVTAANILPIHGNESPLEDWEGNQGTEKIVVNITSVDADYFQVMDMRMADGRVFSLEFPTDLGEAVIVNQEAVRRMGMESPLGKRIWGRSIIGVVKDYHFLSLKNQVAPIIISLTDRHFYNMILRLQPGPTGAGAIMKNVEGVLKRFAPDITFEYHFLEEDLNAMYRGEERVNRQFRSFSITAVFIACLGLIGLAAFTTEKRTKEIGIRKVLGASSSGIVGILTQDFAKLVLIANLFAWPAAYLAMTRWLQGFAYRTPLHWALFAASGLLALAVALAAVGGLALRAARTDPVKTLRNE